MSILLTALAGLVLFIVVVAAAWILGMRAKWPPVLDAQRWVNQHLLNPRQMRSAGTPGAYAGIVRHVGRRSGRAYETPVVPMATEDGFVIVLPYGTRPDWVRNVLAADRAEIVEEGETVVVEAPELTTIDAAPYEFPPKEMRTMRAFGNTQCLVVRRSASTPAT